MHPNTENYPLLAGANELQDLSHLINETTQPLPTGILQQPIDVINELAEYLEDGDRALLSLTCRPLRKMLIQHKKERKILQNLPIITRLSFLALACRDSYTYWVCDICLCLHTVCESDIRGCNPHLTPYRPCNDSLQSTDQNIGFDPVSAMKMSGLRPHHVQIALRYTRLMRESVPDNIAARSVDPSQWPWQRDSYSAEDYLKRLLQLHVARAVPRVSTDPYLIEAKFEHKIIEDPYTTTSAGRHALRYLQHASIIITRMALNPSVFEPGEVVFRICPHLAICRQPVGISVRTRPPFGQAQNVVFIQPHYIVTETRRSNISHRSHNQYYPNRHMQKGSCESCLTDYSYGLMAVTSLKVEMWQDFGEECAPAESEWLGHLGHISNGRKRPMMYFSPGIVQLYHRGYTNRLYMGHERGSIRYFYQELDAVRAWDNKVEEVDAMKKMSLWRLALEWLREKLSDFHQ